MAIIAAVVISAIAAGASAYIRSEQAAGQARAQAQLAERQAASERAAGEARRRQVEYDTRRKQATFRSRTAAAGVQISEGSLLEQEMQFAADSEYAAQIAEYPYVLRAATRDYEGRVLRAQAKQQHRSSLISVGLGTAPTLASGFGSYAGRRSSPASDDS